jgi:hypothetical protein
VIVKRIFFALNKNKYNSFWTLIVTSVSSSSSSSIIIISRCVVICKRSQQRKSLGLDRSLLSHLVCYLVLSPLLTLRDCTRMYMQSRRRKFATSSDKNGSSRIVSLSAVSIRRSVSCYSELPLLMLAIKRGILLIDVLYYFAWSVNAGNLVFALDEQSLLCYIFIPYQDAGFFQNFQLGGETE